MRIEETKRPPVEILAGDLIKFKCTDENEYDYFILVDMLDGSFSLVNLSSGTALKLFNHPVHVLNHVKKHYGYDYQVIKSDRVKVVIE